MKGDWGRQYKYTLTNTREGGREGRGRGYRVGISTETRHGFRFPWIQNLIYLTLTHTLTLTLTLTLSLDVLKTYLKNRISVDDFKKI